MPLSSANYWFIIISQCGVSSYPMCIACKSAVHLVTSGILTVCIIGWASGHQMKKQRLISLEFGFAWLVLYVLPWKWTSIKKELLSVSSFFASLPQQLPTIQTASSFNKLTIWGNIVGTDVPTQLLSAITDSHFIYLSRNAKCGSESWKVLKSIQHPPLQRVAQKLLSSPEATSPEIWVPEVQLLLLITPPGHCWSTA